MGADRALVPLGGEDSVMAPFSLPPLLPLQDVKSDGLAPVRACHHRIAALHRHA